MDGQASGKLSGGLGAICMSTEGSSNGLAIGDLPGSVLFVCSMNSIRSPMAEFIMRKHFGNRVFVQSAGIHQGEPDGFMHSVMQEMGTDVQNHQPKLLDNLEDAYFDLIVTLSPPAHHRALEITRSQAVDVEYWPMFDPSTVAGCREQVLQAYRECRDALDLKIRQRFKER